METISNLSRNIIARLIQLFSTSLLINQLQTSDKWTVAIWPNVTRGVVIDCISTSQITLVIDHEMTINTWDQDHPDLCKWPSYERGRATKYHITKTVTNPIILLAQATCVYSQGFLPNWSQPSSNDNCSNPKPLEAAMPSTPVTWLPMYWPQSALYPPPPTPTTQRVNLN